MARFAAEAPRLAGEIRGLVARYGADLIYVNGPRLLPAAALCVANAARTRKGRAFCFIRTACWIGWRCVWRDVRPRLRARRWWPRAASWPRRCGATAGIAASAWCTTACGRWRFPDVRLRRREFRIGVIGRISPEKGQADFLRAARILHKAAPECRFLICGAPLFSNRAAMRYCAELEALAEDLPVEFAGWTEDVEGVLATLDLLVVPSATVDATPRVILEAFAAGVPVVAFASGGIPEIVEHGATGFLVEQRSPQALAFAMLDRAGIAGPPARGGGARARQGLRRIQPGAISGGDDRSDGSGGGDLIIRRMGQCLEQNALSASRFALQPFMHEDL